MNVRVSYSVLVLGIVVAALGGCQSVGERCAPSPFFDQWRRREINVAGGLLDVHYGAGLWVAVGHDGQIITSADGLEWVHRDSGTSQMLIDVHHANGQWVSVGTNGTVIVSRDGVSWESRTTGTTDWLFDVHHANGVWIAVGGTINEAGGRDVTRTVSVLRSTSGDRWVAQTGVSGEMLLDIHHADGVWVAVGWNGAIVTSVDATNWTPRASNSDQFLLAVDYGDGEWVAAGGKGTIVTSSDGTNWEYQPSGTTNWLHSVTHRDGQWLIVGGDVEHPDYYPLDQSSTVVTRTDAGAWRAINACERHELHGADFADGRWVIVGLELDRRRNLVPLVLTAEELDG